MKRRSAQGIKLSKDALRDGKGGEAGRQEQRRLNGESEGKFSVDKDFYSNTTISKIKKGQKIYFID